VESKRKVSLRPTTAKKKKKIEKDEDNLRFVYIDWGFVLWERAVINATLKDIDEQVQRATETLLEIRQRRQVLQQQRIEAEQKEAMTSDQLLRASLESIVEKIEELDAESQERVFAARKHIVRTFASLRNEIKKRLDGLVK
jgi:hypothetical protein